VAATGLQAGDYDKAIAAQAAGGDKASLSELQMLADAGDRSAQSIIGNY
jgi:hypothetical protein